MVTLPEVLLLAQAKGTRMVRSSRKGQFCSEYYSCSRTGDWSSPPFLDLSLCPSHRRRVLVAACSLLSQLVQQCRLADVCNSDKHEFHAWVRLRPDELKKVLNGSLREIFLTHLLKDSDRFETWTAKYTYMKVKPASSIKKGWLTMAKRGTDYNARFCKLRVHLSYLWQFRTITCA